MTVCENAPLWIDFISKITPMLIYESRIIRHHMSITAFCTIACHWPQPVEKIFRVCLVNYTGAFDHGPRLKVRPRMLSARFLRANLSPRLLNQSSSNVSDISPIFRKTCIPCDYPRCQRFLSHPAKLVVRNEYKFVSKTKLFELHTMAIIS